MRRNSPGKEFSTPTVSLNAFSAQTDSKTFSLGARDNSRAFVGAGSSHGDLLSSEAARITECPALVSAETIERTCTDAPFRPRAGMPRSGHRYRIFIALMQRGYFAAL